MDKSIIILGDSTTPILVTDRSTRKNMNKDIQDFNNATNLIELMFIAHSTQQQNNSRSFQVHVEHLAR